ncbi:MAG: GntR family transcriptional regulator [Spirochaetales bacterium]|nr:GntR family transcriptional regulator [Spirochaetales bacterium]
MAVSNASIPRYVRVIEYIENQIRSGRWKQDDKIPTEEQLCTQFSFARGTIRQAINELVMKDELYRIHGKGTFVGPSKFKAEIGSSCFRSFMEEFIDKGFSFDTVVQYHEQIIPDKEILSFFNADDDEKFLRVCRVRSHSGEKFMYSENHVQLRRFPGFDKLNYSEGLYTTLEKNFGVRFKSVQYYMEAVSADEKLAANLDVRVGHPLLLITQIEYDEMGTCLDVAHNWMLSDRIRLSTGHNIER